MSSLPVILNLERKRGDTKPFRWVLKDESSVLVPLAGYVFLLTVDTLKSPPDNTTKVFEVSGTLVSDGNVSFTPTASDTDILGTYYYDIQMTDPLGIIFTVAEGRVKFKQDITK